MGGGGGGGGGDVTGSETKIIIIAAAAGGGIFLICMVLAGTAVVVRRARVSKNIPFDPRLSQFSNFPGGQPYGSVPYSLAGGNITDVRLMNQNMTMERTMNSASFQFGANPNMMMPQKTNSSSMNFNNNGSQNLKNSNEVKYGDMTSQGQQYDRPVEPTMTVQIGLNQSRDFVYLKWLFQFHVNYRCFVTSWLQGHEVWH